jgi:DNA-directed RNA polymerase subunit M/transcription elongation factor TFIIS
VHYVSLGGVYWYYKEQAEKIRQQEAGAAPQSELVCPKCGSAAVGMLNRVWDAKAEMLVPEFRCGQCGNQWRGELGR